jgi:hypothetical protein
VSLAPATRAVLLPALLALAAGSTAGCASTLPGPGPGSLRMYRLPLLTRPPPLLTPPARFEPVEDLEYAPVNFDPTDRRLAALDGAAVAATAASYLGTRAGRDCSGFVTLVYRQHGIDLWGEGGLHGDNGVRVLWRFAERRGGLHRRSNPDPGDLVFFDDTYDRNRDGRWNDPLTHIGIVEKVEGDRIFFVHLGSRGVVRSVMSLSEPNLSSRNGQLLNDYIRFGRRRPSDRLAGALFAGFGKLAGR